MVDANFEVISVIEYQGSGLRHGEMVHGIYPSAVGVINFYSCHDPDPGNYGAGADFLVSHIRLEG